MASSVSEVVLRGAHYFQKEGFKNAVFRLYTRLKRCAYFNRKVVYWMDLSTWSPATACLEHGYTLVAITQAAEIPENLRTRIAEEFPAKIVNAGFASDCNRKPSYGACGMELKLWVTPGL
jgi:hypothetical protein